MSQLTIYHNPKCSKSRATLELLRERGLEPDVVEYLKTPPTVDELDRILGMLGMEPRDLARKKEAEYKAAGMDDDNLERGELIALMVANPKVIERPIVVRDDRAAIGRPPEQVLEILD